MSDVVLSKERELMQIEMPVDIVEALGIEKAGKGLFIWGDANITKCNSVVVYEQGRYISSERQFDQEKTHLRWGFANGMFNSLHYYNQNSNWHASVLGFISDMDRLNRFFRHMEKDIIGGHLPFKYRLFKTVNVNKIRRQSSDVI